MKTGEKRRGKNENGVKRKDKWENIADRTKENKKEQNGKVRGQNCAKWRNMLDSHAHCITH